MSLFDVSEINIDRDEKYELPKQNEIHKIRFTTIHFFLVIAVLIFLCVMMVYSFYEGSDFKGALFLLLLVITIYRIVIVRNMFSKGIYLALSDVGINYKGQEIPWDAIESIGIDRKRNKLRTISKLVFSTKAGQAYKISLMGLSKSAKEIAHLIHCYRDKKYRLH